MIDQTRPAFRTLPRARRSAGALGVVAAVLAAVLAASPASAALAGFNWPVQSVGNRGVDVKAIQMFLRARGIPVLNDAVFTAETAAGVKRFQAAKGLPQTGIVDGATWGVLVVPVAPGASGEAVTILQFLLRQKNRAAVTATGTWDAATTTAVRSFEQHVGLPVDGTADQTMWRYLIAHNDLPSFSSLALCDYSVGNGPANWGTGAAIGQTEAAGLRVVAARLGRVAVGDVSLEHGGDIAGHQSHERGLDVDLRPIRDNRDQCRWGTNWRYSSYDRTATRALIKAIRETAPGHVKLIYFNDPTLVREGIVASYTGHDDHLHVRYCEAWHPLTAYRCPPVATTDLSEDGRFEH